MSTEPKIKILTHSEVHKKIVEHTPKIRPYEDQIGPYGRYNNENYTMYLNKKKLFEETRKKYSKMNEETLNSCKPRLHENYTAALDLEFLIDDAIEIKERDKKEKNLNGILINKRTVRKAHFKPIQDSKIPCNLELWFRRYLILNKFIWAARTVIIKNRLSKRLEILKQLDGNISKYETPYYVGMYKEIFENFINI